MLCGYLSEVLEEVDEWFWRVGMLSQGFVVFIGLPSFFAVVTVPVFY